MVVFYPSEWLRVCPLKRTIVFARDVTCFVVYLLIYAPRVFEPAPVPVIDCVVLIFALIGPLSHWSLQRNPSRSDVGIGRDD